MRIHRGKKNDSFVDADAASRLVCTASETTRSFLRRSRKVDAAIGSGLFGHATVECVSVDWPSDQRGRERLQQEGCSFFKVHNWTKATVP